MNKYPLISTIFAYDLKMLFKRLKRLKKRKKSNVFAKLKVIFRVKRPSAYVDILC